MENKEDEEKFIPVQEQIDIIQSHGKSMIVSASAGSGKTSVMIRKICDLVANRYCLTDQLLVLTYTKSAAQEMKKKLLDKLKEENVDGKLADEIEKVYTADISTFDSFCQKLVKKYFYKLSIDPTFGVLDSESEERFKDLAISTSIKQLKNTNPLLYEKLLENFSPKRDERKIYEVIKKIHTFLVSVLNYDEFLQKSEKFYDYNEKIAEKYLKTHYSNILGELLPEMEQLQKRAKQLNFESYCKYLSGLLSEVANVKNAKDFCQMVELAFNVNYGRLNKDKQNDEIGFNETISDKKNEIKKYIDEIKEYESKEQIQKSYAVCGDLIRAIIFLERVFIEKYDALKRSKNIFDFNDIERFTISLLENEDILAQVKKQYKYVFIDEFQDANEIQEKIIFTIGKDNLFFVGDTKQSIYAFRQSDPKIFLKVEDSFKKDSNFMAMFLNCNFRTNKNILDFVNEVFSVIMTSKTCGIDYKNNSMFNPKANYKEVLNEVCVSINLIDQKKIEKKEPTEIYDLAKENIYITENHTDECLFVCQQIASLIGQTIYDKDEKEFRKIKLSDITILILKRGKFLDELTSQMTKLGISYNMDTGDVLEDQYDSKVLFNLLKLTVNPKDDYALYMVLTSKLFDFTNEELSVIKLQKNLNILKNKQINQDCISLEDGKNLDENAKNCEKLKVLDHKNAFFYEFLENYANLDNELGKKIRDFYNALSSFAFDVKYNGIYYALSKIIKDKNYILKIADDPKYETRQLVTYSYIDSFIGSEYNYNYLSYLTLKETSKRQNKLKQENNSIDAVTISTMHSSKGLEYPVVILPNLDQNFMLSKDNNEIKINQDFGIGVKAYNDETREVSNGIFYNAVKKKNYETELSEKIRLLYVATTRAKNKLIISAKNTKNYKKIITDNQVKYKRDFISLILGSLNQDLIDRINSGQEFTTTLFNNDKIVLNAFGVEDITKDEDKNAMHVFKHDENVDKLLDFLSKDLSKNIIKVPLKNSVSKIAFDGGALNFAPKNLTMGEHLADTSSSMGTLYHSILENIEFNNVNSAEDVKLFINCNLDALCKYELLKVYNSIKNDNSSTLGDLNYNLTESQINDMLDEVCKNIYQNISVLRQQTLNAKAILKEQKFVMNIKHSEIVLGGEDCKILVQGVMDLVAVFDDHVLLIDYKLSHKSKEQLIKNYQKQLEIYKLALSKKYKNVPVVCKILSLYNNELIEIS